MAQIEVFKLHGANIPCVWDFYLILIALAVCSRLGAISGLRGDRLGKDILLVKQHLKIVLYLVNGKLTLMERRQNGQQHIGIVLDLVQIKMVFVIIVGLLIGVQILPQFILHRAVGGLCRQQVLIFGEIRGRDDVGHASTENRGTGLQQPQQHDQQQADPAHDQKRLFVFGNKLSGLLRRIRAFLCALRCRLRRCRRVPGAMRRPVCGGILLLQLLFLPHPGNEVTGRKLRILPQCLLIQRIRIGLDRRLLCAGYLPPGFQLAVRLPVLKPAVSVADSLFHAALRQVSRLHADIFLLHLMHLRMGGVADLLQRPRQRIHRLMERG